MTITMMTLTTGTKSRRWALYIDGFHYYFDRFRGEYMESFQRASPWGDLCQRPFPFNKVIDEKQARGFSNKILPGCPGLSSKLKRRVRARRSNGSSNNKEL